MLRFLVQSRCQAGSRCPPPPRTRVLTRTQDSAPDRFRELAPRARRKARRKGGQRHPSLESWTAGVAGSLGPTRHRTAGRRRRVFAAGAPARGATGGEGGGATASTAWGGAGRDWRAWGVASWRARCEENKRQEDRVRNPMYWVAEDDKRDGSGTAKCTSSGNLVQRSVIFESISVEN